jgi:pimeloyl-ACP methyl ester carboxylesterase
MTEPPKLPPNARPIQAEFDNRGDPVWRSRMSPPDNTFALCFMVPDRIVPVIFVPGVMGSNLRGMGDASGVKWRLDSTSAMKSWLVRGAAERKRYLAPPAMEVDDGGAITAGTLQMDEDLRRRGWGEVGAISYGEFLVWLENALSDFNDPHQGERVALMSRSLDALVGEELLRREEVSLSYRYRFPMHACGYNWLDSNAKSAERLAQRIDSVIARYRSEKKRCEKVIIVTHSMGGLVARHCSEALGYRDKIFGIVHGVMPALGAPAVYRRFKAGTEGPYLASEVLGNDAAEMTAVLSSAPGPLQLLPTAEYGNGWLKIKDGSAEYSFPKNGDPYSEIYAVRGKWWSMCEDTLMNPLNTETNPARRQAQMDRDWANFADLVRKARNFHDEIADAYHHHTHAFFGSHRDNLAYGTVTWRGDGGGWLRGDRSANVLDARSVVVGEIKGIRTVAAPLPPGGWATAERQTYQISTPDEPGDGTVPHRSGVAPRERSKSFMQVNVGHEPAFRHAQSADNLRACRFTLRAIVKIAQQVTSTSLKYE